MNVGSICVLAAMLLCSLSCLPRAQRCSSSTMKLSTTFWTNACLNESHKHRDMTGSRRGHSHVQQGATSASWATGVPICAGASHHSETKIHSAPVPPRDQSQSLFTVYAFPFRHPHSSPHTHTCPPSITICCTIRRRRRKIILKNGCNDNANCLTYEIISDV